MPQSRRDEKKLKYPLNFSCAFSVLCYSLPPREPGVWRGPFSGDGADQKTFASKIDQTMKKNDASPARARKSGPATAASILGSGAAPARALARAKIKPQWAGYYRHLMELRERLVHQMSGLAKESAEEMSNYSLHMADSGTDNFDRDFALSLLSSDQDAIYEIEEALKRIERGTYGVCELTDKPIPPQRLEAIPWTRFTVEAQSQLEREGALRQRRLGQLGTVDTTSGSDSDEDEEAEEKPAKEKE
jgi:DnaK suppressor protein